MERSGGRRTPMRSACLDFSLFPQRPCGPRLLRRAQKAGLECSRPSTRIARRDVSPMLCIQARMISGAFVREIPVKRSASVRYGSAN
jgi:hypothetical protein